MSPTPTPPSTAAPWQKEAEPMTGTGSPERHASPQSGGSICISLDFELMWGVRDKRTIDQYGANILGGRDVVPRMLDLFEQHSIRATWATVGLLFCETKDEMLETMPALRPTYDDPKLSSYSYLDEVGENENRDPYYFAANLLGLVHDCPGQEIATHTFSHYYCLEPGQTRAQLGADLDAAIAVAGRRGVTLKSIVFPRNQYDDSAIAECAQRGISVYRGNETSWMYRPGGRADQTLSRRGVRLADAYMNLSGANTASIQTEKATTDVRSSRFLRPYSRRFRILESFRLSRITQAMTQAARTGETFHFWWHPHNFGSDQAENLNILSRILDHFETLRGDYGMVSLAMEDFVSEDFTGEASTGKAFAN